MPELSEPLDDEVVVLPALVEPPVVVVVPAEVWDPVRAGPLSPVSLHAAASMKQSPHPNEASLPPRPMVKGQTTHRRNS